MVALATAKIVKKSLPIPPKLPVAQTTVPPAPVKPTPVKPPTPIQEPAPVKPAIATSNEKVTVGRIQKDSYSKLPDTYRIRSVSDNSDLGLAAIRSLAISKQLRVALQTAESVVCDIQWFEPFQKYEVKKIHA
jgi:aspartate-semialdehyde dehydrogenase